MRIAVLVLGILLALSIAVALIALAALRAGGPMALPESPPTPAKSAGRLPDKKR